MNTKENFAIDPLSMSFRQLRTLVAGTTGKRLPQPEALCGSAKALFHHKTGDAAVTVFSNGFFLYETGDDAGVYAVDRCRELHYRDPDGNARIIREKEFCDGPCLVPLLMAGDQEMARSMEDYEFYWHAFCEDGAAE